MTRRSREEVSARVLEGIRTFSQKHGYPPSYRELAEYVGVAHSNVWYAVQDLRKSGLVNDAASSSSARTLVLSRAGVRAARELRTDSDAVPV